MRRSFSTVSLRRCGRCGGAIPWWASARWHEVQYLEPAWLCSRTCLLAAVAACLDGGTEPDREQERKEVAA